MGPVGDFLDWWLQSQGFLVGNPSQNVWKGKTKIMFVIDNHILWRRSFTVPGYLQLRIYKKQCIRIPYTHMYIYVQVPAMIFELSSENRKTLFVDVKFSYASRLGQQKKWIRRCGPVVGSRSEVQSNRKTWRRKKMVNKFKRKHTLFEKLVPVTQPFQDRK